MKNRLSDRMLWLAVGTAAGLCIARFWPHEPAQAATNDRDSKFAMGTCSVSLADNVEGVFVLDFLTGRLQGAVLNPNTGKFMNAYYRNLAADFGVDPKAEPHYVFVSGKASLPSRGRLSAAQCAIYVGELTSGKVIAYWFPYNVPRRKMAPVQLQVLDFFQFREAAVGE